MGRRLAIARNLAKAWLLLAVPAAAMGFVGLQARRVPADAALRRLGRPARRGALLVRGPDRDGDGRRARAPPRRGARAAPLRRAPVRPCRRRHARSSISSRTRYPRALSGGRGARGGAALAVSTGLLAVATPAELEGILAHELAHLRRRDVLVQTLAVDACGARWSRHPGSAAGSSGRSSSCSGRWPRPSSTCCSRRSASTRPTGSPPSCARSPHGLADALLRLESTMELVAFQASPATEPLYVDEPVRRRGAGGALRHAPAARRACPPAARPRSRVARQAARRVRLQDDRNDRPRLRGPSSRNGRRPTLPGDCSPSTIGASGLNFSVRNGKRCFPAAMTAQIVRLPLSGESRAANERAHPQNSIAA